MCDICWLHEIYTCSVTSSLGLQLVSRTCQEPVIFLFHWNYCRPLKFLWEWFEKQILEGRWGALCKCCCTGAQREKKKQHCLCCWRQIICFLKSSVKAGSSREIWSHPLGGGKDICISPSLHSRNMRKYRRGCSKSNAFYSIVLVHSVRGGCLWYGCRGWIFLPVFYSMLLLCDRWLKCNLTKWCTVRKIRKGGQ